MEATLDPRPVLVPARPLADLVELAERAASRLAEVGGEAWLVDALWGATAEVRSRVIHDVAPEE